MLHQLKEQDFPEITTLLSNNEIQLIYADATL